MDSSTHKEAYERDQAVIDAIIVWAYSLPPEWVEVRVEKDVVSVIPSNPNAAGFEVFPEHDKEFNLCLAGETMLPWMGRELALDLCQAIADGRFERTIWQRGQRVSRVKTEFLTLTRDVFYTYNSGTFSPWLESEPPRTFRYEPYSV